MQERKQIAYIGNSDLSKFSPLHLILSPSDEKSAMLSLESPEQKYTAFSLQSRESPPPPGWTGITPRTKAWVMEKGKGYQQNVRNDNTLHDYQNDYHNGSRGENRNSYQQNVRNDNTLHDHQNGSLAENKNSKLESSVDHKRNKIVYNKSSISTRSQDSPIVMKHSQGHPSKQNIQSFQKLPFRELSAYQSPYKTEQNFGKESLIWKDDSPLRNSDKVLHFSHEKSLTNTNLSMKKVQPNVQSITSHPSVSRKLDQRPPESLRSPFSKPTPADIRRKLLYTIYLFKALYPSLHPPLNDLMKRSKQSEDIDCSDVEEDLVELICRFVLIEKTSIGAFTEVGLTIEEVLSTVMGNFLREGIYKLFGSRTHIRAVEVFVERQFSIGGTDNLNQNVIERLYDTIQKELVDEIRVMGFFQTQQEIVHLLKNFKVKEAFHEMMING